ncbi:MAG: prephenate dehydratase [Gemmatimonadetes bacterium]|nr:prephenate dehydratase [Gemmatimonadota bacterium]
MRVAFLGPRGTYSEEAALRHASHASQLVPFGTIAAVIAAVQDGAADQAVVPIENSLEGAVTHTTDLLIHSTDLLIHSMDLRICREIVLPIHHCLLVQTGFALPLVRAVYSHPQSLAQCRGYIAEHLPEAEPVASLSTAGAVRDMGSSTRPAAAITSRRAAEIFGAKIFDHNIEDSANNKTRFVVLAPHDAEPTGRDKTSICLDFAEDGPGILHGALGELASRGINMLKIESRPDRRSLGRYIFLIDIEGHREDEVVREALRGVRGRAALFRVLGSYPQPDTRESA